MKIKAPKSRQVRDYVEASLSFGDKYHGTDEHCGILFLMEGLYADAKVTVYPPA